MASFVATIFARPRATLVKQTSLAIQRIIHPTDLSPVSEAAFAWAIDLARQNQAELLLVHVLSPPTPIFEAKSPAWRQAEATLKGLLQRTQQERVTAKRLLVKGLTSIDKQIVEVAETTGADLIVMGTHGRTAIRKMFVGSVASRVIARARCPVLVVRGNP